MTHRAFDFGAWGVRIGIALAALAAFALMVTDAEAQQATRGLDQKAALAASQSAIGRQVGDHEFTDSRGKRVRLSGLRGKPFLVNFVYTGCYEVCPTTTRFLVKAVASARASLGSDAFYVLTIGFNLPFDHPIAMKNFADRHGADQPGWYFLSPDAASLDRVLDDFGFTYAQTAKGFDHVLQVTVVDGEGRIYRQIYGDSFDLPLLVGPLKDVLTGIRSAGPAFGDWLEKVRLLCTVYDPSAGRYRFNYAVLIELFVGASILIAGSFSLFLEWRRRRSSHH